MIDVEDLAITLGTFELENISFHVPRGEHGVLMGKTGSGKTTILEAICGLRPVKSGSIRLGGKEVVGLRPADRGIGFVPQDGALFSTLTVREHLSFALDVRRLPRDRIDARVAELADLLQIEHLLERRPLGLSGGERQRVSLGRALSFEPEILCMDEPLSALDEDTRAEICELIADVSGKTHVTTLHITHSLTEARALGDLLLVIEDGVVCERSFEPEPTPGEPREGS